VLLLNALHEPAAGVLTFFAVLQACRETTEKGLDADDLVALMQLFRAYAAEQFRAVTLSLQANLIGELADVGPVALALLVCNSGGQDRLYALFHWLSFITIIDIRVGKFFPHLQTEIIIMKKLSIVPELPQGVLEGTRSQQHFEYYSPVCSSMKKLTLFKKVNLIEVARQQSQTAFSRRMLGEFPVGFEVLE